MAYADWSFYADTYLGNVISKEDFPRLALRASETIDDITRNRANAYFLGNSAPVASAACAVAEVMFQFERFQRSADGRQTIAAESNDGASWTYATPIDPSTEQGQKAYQQQLQAAASKYLRWTGLLYAGVIVR